MPFTHQRGLLSYFVCIVSAPAPDYLKILSKRHLKFHCLLLSTLFRKSPLHPIHSLITHRIQATLACLNPIQSCLAAWSRSCAWNSSKLDSFSFPYNDRTPNLMHNTHEDFQIPASKSTAFEICTCNLKMVTYVVTHVVNVVSKSKALEICGCCPELMCCRGLIIEIASLPYFLWSHGTAYVFLVWVILLMCHATNES